MEYQTELCRLASIGYDLDGGGYAFEPFAPLGGRAIALDLDGGEWDYFPQVSNLSRSDIRQLTLPIAVFYPQFGFGVEVAFPKAIYGKDGSRLRRVESGWLAETDRDCNCHGKWYEYTIGAENKRVKEWEFTGNTNDNPHPDCDRCEGSGYINSPGGDWAIYAQVDDSKGRRR